MSLFLVADVQDLKLCFVYHFWWVFLIDDLIFFSKQFWEVRKEPVSSWSLAYKERTNISEAQAIMFALDNVN